MELTEAREGVFDMRIGDLAPSFRYQWILDGGRPPFTVLGTIFLL